ncbi:SCF ubiquitin ligase complex subunit UFO1 [Saccharomyces paradoxus]|uniref:SCF ubiquitin ligase complex subunit UFO1 n=1 Tax=Saccharomyces paradoxus TaxID=27291 RepID=A0A8B8UWT7_SACPA|nr:Ufo1 [Saccharomyces paradoxus]QHS75198.1 Ufo1 [Saccharomyces paradoxus]
MERSGLVLQDLPPEILINIFSHLDEKDLFTLQELSTHFRNLIHDEELWKNLFKSRVHTTHFPTFSQSSKFSVEYIERTRGLHHWQHNKAIRTKYTIMPTRNWNQPSIERIVFDYPRVAAYNDGTITILQLQNHKRQKKFKKLIYIPCTTPQGCSTMDFNINAAVFGRFDGRVFGKLLSNKSYLTPVMEFTGRHSAGVTAICNSESWDTSREDWSVSGSENGEVIWWCENKLVKMWKVSNRVIWKLAFFKDWTLIMDDEKLYIIYQMQELHSIDIPRDAGEQPMRVRFFKMDFGSMTLVLADLNNVYTISVNPNGNFGNLRKLEMPEQICAIEIDAKTSQREQNWQFAGDDGCYISLLTIQNILYIINIRDLSAAGLKVQCKISFDEQVYVSQVTNLIVVVALPNTLQILNAMTGELIKSVLKTDKFPEFLKVSQDKIIMGSGNVLNYLTFVSGDSKKHHHSSKGKNAISNKWNETLNTELQYYDEDEDLRRKRQSEISRLINAYGGDLEFLGNADEEDDIQLRIALLESQEVQARNQAETGELLGDDEDEQLRRALEESQLIHQAQMNRPANQNNNTNDEIDEDDEEFLRAIRQSRLEDERRRDLRSHATGRRNGPLSDEAFTTDGADSSEQASTENTIDSAVGVDAGNNVDEDLQLAIALSLSEIN